MRTRMKLACVVVSTATATIICIYILAFTGPYRFVDRQLSQSAIEHLREGALKKAAWTGSPAATAIEYLGADTPDSRYIRTRVSDLSSTEAIVSVFDSSGDDSVYLTCDRITMRLENTAWIPIRDQQAWQGRGRFGWTTQPCL